MKELTEEQRLERNARARAYYHSHKEICRANQKRWQEKNREHFLELMRVNAAKWRKEHAEYNKIWQRLYDQKRRAIKRGDSTTELACALSMKMMQDARRRKKI